MKKDYKLFGAYFVFPFFEFYRDFDSKNLDFSYLSLSFELRPVHKSYGNVITASPGVWKYLILNKSCTFVGNI